jgi:hypothetical protein
MRSRTRTPARRRFGRRIWPRTGSQRVQYVATLSVAFGLVGAVAISLLTHDVALGIVGGAIISLVSLHISQMNQSLSLPPKIAKLEPALNDEELYGFLVAAVTTRSAAASLAEEHGPASELLRNHLHTLFKRAEDAFKQLQGGRIVVEDGNEIPFANACVPLFDHRMRAVSYKEDRFWGQAQGTKYLRKQTEHARAKGAKITRIFILPEADIAGWEERIKAQCDAGVETRVLPLERLTDTPIEPEDFILYDEDYVRHAISLDLGGLKKVATLSLHLDEVHKYEGWWETWYDMSDPARKHFPHWPEEPRSWWARLGRGPRSAPNGSARGRSKRPGS